MQIQVSDYQLPEVIQFNYEELKTELAEKLQHYETVVYSEDDIKDAKGDRANLNKLKDALDTERKNRKNAYLAPFETFEKQIKELVGMVDDATKCIDKQVKAFEDKKKEEKREDIKALWATMDAPGFVTLEKVWNEKWLNASVRESAIKKEMEERLAQIQQELTIIDSLAGRDVARQIYEETLSLAQANTEAERIAKIQAAVEEKKVAEIAPEETPKPDTISAEEPKEYKFSVMLTKEQGMALGAFCKAHGIKLTQIK